MRTVHVSLVCSHDIKHRLDAALIPGYGAIQQIALSRVTKTVKREKAGVRR